jgi:hypothetical protein
MTNSKRNAITRRDFIQLGAATGGLLGAGSTLMSSASANRHPHPRPTSLQYLDRNMYRKNTDVRAIFELGTHRGNKMQMMAIGSRRFLFQAGDVIDVTNPLKPVMFNKRGFIGGQLQLAYNRKLGKWILMTGEGSEGTFSTPQWPNGKYDNPDLVARNINQKGLRGVRVYDATDPAKIALLSEWSCDQGDPKRVVQTGSGTHRNYYDGGQYAYLDTAPDNDFTRMESSVRHYSNGIQIIDLSDPMQPKFVANWWLPGQRKDEEEAYKKWREYGDKKSFTTLHGPMYVPKKVEDGGRHGYSAYSALGMMIHDLSDIKNPKLIGRFYPKIDPGAIPFHTIDIVRLDRGFVITNPETLNPDCNEPLQALWVVDVRDPTNPKPISKLPVPQPPPDAPYKTFCDKRGRFGSHNPPHMKAPGKPHPHFTAYSFFNAGAQMFDITNPKAVRNVGYFIPPQPGGLDDYLSYPRDTDNVFVEWDRKLMWVGTGTGLYLVTSPALGKPLLEPMAVAEWTLPGLNVGHA